MLTNKENCALKLDDEIIPYYDARSKKHRNTVCLRHYTHSHKIVKHCKSIYHFTAHDEVGVAKGKKPIHDPFATLGNTSIIKESTNHKQDSVQSKLHRGLLSSDCDVLRRPEV